MEKRDNNLFAWIIRSNKILGIVAEIDGNTEISPLSKRINRNNTFLKAIVFGLYGMGKFLAGLGSRIIMDYEKDVFFRFRFNEEMLP